MERHFSSIPGSLVLSTHIRLSAGPTSNLSFGMQTTVPLSLAQNPRVGW